MLVRQRTHNRTDRQTVEIIIYEDQDTQRDGSHLRAELGLDMLYRPASERSRASGAVHQHDHGAEHHEEYQYADIPRVRQRAYHAVHKDVLHRALKGKARVEQTSAYDAYKQR